MSWGQLIGGTGISNVYRPINRGKEIQDWIKRNPTYTYIYYTTLLGRLRYKISFRPETILRIREIQQDLYMYMMLSDVTDAYATTAVFRYKQTYIATKYSTNTELPIDLAVAEYMAYLQWKSSELKWLLNKLAG